MGSITPTQLGPEQLRVNRINVNIPPIEPSRLILEEMLGGVGSNAD